MCAAVNELISPTVALEDNSHIPDEGVIVSVIQHGEEYIILSAFAY
jgi:hypothetical protein